MQVINCHQPTQSHFFGSSPFSVTGGSGSVSGSSVGLKRYGRHGGTTMIYRKPPWSLHVAQTYKIG